MASVWIRERSTKSGTSYRVEYRPGGRDAGTRFAGSFRTKRLAVLRAAAVERELAELRLPDLTFADAEPAAPTFAVAAARWLDSRIDVSDGTKVQNRTSVGRAFPIIGDRRVNELEPHDVAAMVARLHREGVAVGYLRQGHPSGGDDASSPCTACCRPGTAAAALP